MDNFNLPPSYASKHPLVPSQYGFSSGTSLCAGISIPQPDLPRLSAVHNLAHRDPSSVVTYSVQELPFTGSGPPLLQCDRVNPPPPMPLYNTAPPLDACEGVCSPIFSPNPYWGRSEQPSGGVSSGQLQSSSDRCWSSGENIGSNSGSWQSPASTWRLSHPPVDVQYQGAAPAVGHLPSAPPLVISDYVKQAVIPLQSLDSADLGFVNENNHRGIVYQNTTPNFGISTAPCGVAYCPPTFSQRSNSSQQAADCNFSSRRPPEQAEKLPKFGVETTIGCKPPILEVQPLYAMSSSEDMRLNLISYLNNRKVRLRDAAVALPRREKHDLPIITSPQGVRLAAIQSEQRQHANSPLPNVPRSLTKLIELYLPTEKAQTLSVLSVEQANICRPPILQVSSVAKGLKPDHGVQVSFSSTPCQDVLKSSQIELQRLAHPVQTALPLDQKVIPSHTTPVLNTSLSREDVEKPSECQQPATSIGSVVGLSTCNSLLGATSNNRISGLSLACSFVKKHRKRKFEFIDLSVGESPTTDCKQDFNMLPGTSSFSSDTERKDAAFSLAGKVRSESSISEGHPSIPGSSESDVTLQDDLVRFSGKDMPPLSLMEEVNEFCADARSVVEIVSPMLTEQLYHKENAPYEAVDGTSESVVPIHADVNGRLSLVMEDGMDVRSVSVLPSLREDTKQNPCLQNVQSLCNENAGTYSSRETVCDQPEIGPSTENVVEIDIPSGNVATNHSITLQGNCSLGSEPSFQPVVLVRRLPEKVLKDAPSGANVLTKKGFKTKRVRNLDDFLDSSDIETGECPRKIKDELLDPSNVEAISISRSDLASPRKCKDGLPLSDSDDAHERSLCTSVKQGLSTKARAESTRKASLSGSESKQSSMLADYSSGPVQLLQERIERTLSNGTTCLPTHGNPVLPALEDETFSIDDHSMRQNLSGKKLEARKSFSPERRCEFTSTSKVYALAADKAFSQDSKKCDHSITSKIRKLTTPSSMLLDDAGVFAGCLPSDPEQHSSLRIPNTTLDVKCKFGGIRNSGSANAERSHINRVKSNRQSNLSHPLSRLPLRVIDDGSRYRKRLLKMKRRGAVKKLRRTVLSLPAEHNGSNLRCAPCVKQRGNNDQLSAGSKFETRSNLGSASLQLYRLGGVHMKPVGKVSLRVEAQGGRCVRVSYKRDQALFGRPPSSILSLKLCALPGTS